MFFWQEWMHRNHGTLVNMTNVPTSSLCFSQECYSPDQNSCNKFNHCFKGIAHNKACPNGLVWNTQNNLCEWKEKVSGKWFWQNLRHLSSPLRTNTIPQKLGATHYLPCNLLSGYVVCLSSPTCFPSFNFFTHLIHGDRPELLKCRLILCLYDSILNTEISLSASRIHWRFFLSLILLI